MTISLFELKARVVKLSGQLKKRIINAALIEDMGSSKS